MASYVSLDEKISLDIQQIPIKIIFDLYKSNLIKLYSEHLNKITNLNFNNINFIDFKRKYDSTTIIINEYFKSITTKTAQTSEDKSRHFDNFISVIIILSFNLTNMSTKKILVEDEDIDYDFVDTKSQINTYLFDLIMTVFNIYINNDYTESEKEEQINAIMTNYSLLKKYLIYKKSIYVLRKNINYFILTEIIGNSFSSFESKLKLTFLGISSYL